MQEKVPTKLILIWALTGGPGLIGKIISSLCPPKKESFVIALHMDPLGISSYANRLSGFCGFTVDLVTEDYYADLLQKVGPITELVIDLSFCPLAALSLLHT
ncbi:chemotaxis protein CheB [Nitrosophilus labii]|uniref:chemotaxis protein CheB n=1 Tax=Nitrosophilus labii TaxID=2706014 RepID=UPI0016575D96|nr:chemotaxis protein CheB [Nitrosophilus labii]